MPVGIFLSGGIDSSTNAALFAEDAVEKVKTFTIGYEGENKTYANDIVIFYCYTYFAILWCWIVKIFFFKEIYDSK